ncbi:MAG: hypothetical protein ACRDYY_06645 [Acidimicrobiales bacterium]
MRSEVAHRHVHDTMVQAAQQGNVHAEGTDTIPQIEHIVVLMMENRSYDNKLGLLRRSAADGFRIGRDGLRVETNPYPDGDIQHAFPHAHHLPASCRTQPDLAQQPYPVRRRA